MSIKDRKQREKEQLKKTILDAAFEIINEDGFQAFTIRKLASRIEYSPRTIYLYYADKDDLLKAIVEYGFAATVRNLEANNFYRNLSAEEHLKTAITNHLRTAAENVNYYNTVIHVIQGNGFEPGPNQKIFERYLNDSLKSFLKKDGVEPEFSLFFLSASLRGIAVELINRRLPSGEEELNRTIEMVFSFYQNLLEL